MKKALIVIPVYNEENTLEKVVENTISIASPFADILLINDSSTDGSRVILAKLQLKYPWLKVINRSFNMGYGRAMIDGFNTALEGEYPFVITMDCDDQHDPRDLEAFCNESFEFDVVSGSRYMNDSRSLGLSVPQDRLAVNRRITAKLNENYNFQLTDSFCGFKRYSTAKLKGHQFTENGYAFPMEFWAYAHSKNLKIKEIPVNRIYVTDDRSFGDDLDNCRRRYRYYLKIWQKTHSKYSSSTIAL